MWFRCFPFIHYQFGLAVFCGLPLALKHDISESMRQYTKKYRSILVEKQRQKEDREWFNWQILVFLHLNQNTRFGLERRVGWSSCCYLSKGGCTEKREGPAGGCWGRDSPNWATQQQNATGPLYHQYSIDRLGHCEENIHSGVNGWTCEINSYLGRKGRADGGTLHFFFLTILTKTAQNVPS